MSVCALPAKRLLVISPVRTSKTEGIAEGYLSECEREVKRLNEAILDWQRHLATATEENERLRTALKTYGLHLEDCASVNYEPAPCTCGFIAALGKYKGT